MLIFLPSVSGILETAVKITNEPPTGMQANLHQALDNFDQVWKISYFNKRAFNFQINQIYLTLTIFKNNHIGQPMFEVFNPTIN